MATTKKDQPDFGDDQSVIDWLMEEDLTQEEKQRRALLVEGNYTRSPDANVAVLNALASVRQGPPSANQ